MKFEISDFGDRFIRKPHCRLTEFWSNFETSKYKKVNFNPLKNFQNFLFFIFPWKTLIKGYKSQSQAKITQIYSICQVPPSKCMSKNDEKSVIFDDFDKIHDFQECQIEAELVKTAWDWVLMTSLLLLSPIFLRKFFEIF